MKKFAILVLFLSFNSFAQKKVTLKDLGSIDYNKTIDELSNNKDEKTFSTIQQAHKNATEKKLSDQKRQKKSLWENSSHNPNRKNSFGK